MVNWAGRLATYPPEVAHRYRSAGLWGDVPLATEFHRAATEFPHRQALISQEGLLTYAELDQVTDRLALGLHDAGFMPGERVLVQLSNRLKTVIAWYGLLKAGLIPVCTLAAHREHEVGSISRKVEAVAHLVEQKSKGFDLIAFAKAQTDTHPTMRSMLTIDADASAPGTRIEDLIDLADAQRAREVVEAIQSEIDADAIVAFQLSGGTTGVPKIIPRLQAEYWYNANAFSQVLGWGEETRVAHLLPIIHNAGITCALHAIHAVGGTLILGTPDLDQALPLLIRERANAMLVGHAHFRVGEHTLFARVAESLTQVVLGGGVVTDRVFDAFESRGIRVSQKFGMGEGLFTLTALGAPRTVRQSSVGLPISPADEFRVLDPDSETELPDGEIGELACRGPYTIRGYFDAPDINEKSFTGDGFYRTGDLVAVNVIDGYRTITMEGRLKDLINRGGEKISAEEVEGLLVSHARISAAAVVAMPDERLGERACAFLVPAGEPLTMGEVQEHLQEKGLSKFKWPERVEWITTMPRTAVGKLDKRSLRTDLLKQLGQNAGVSPASDQSIDGTDDGAKQSKTSTRSG